MITFKKIGGKFSNKYEVAANGAPVGFVEKTPGGNWHGFDVNDKSVNGSLRRTRRDAAGVLASLHIEAQQLTANSIRKIADESGFEHALFVAEQEATQRGKSNMEDVFAELAKMENEVYS